LTDDDTEPIELRYSVVFRPGRYLGTQHERSVYVRTTSVPFEDGAPQHVPGAPAFIIGQEMTAIGIPTLKRRNSPARNPDTVR
jgi:hypothetical protein